MRDTGDDDSAKLLSDLTANLEDYIASKYSPIDFYERTVDCTAIVKFVLLTYALLGGEMGDL